MIILSFLIIADANKKGEKLMSKERTIACQYYMCEGDCALDREGTFWRYCQHCPDYIAIRGGKPARKNLKKEKLRDARKRELRDSKWE